MLIGIESRRPNRKLKGAGKACVGAEDTFRAGQHADYKAYGKKSRRPAICDIVQGADKPKDCAAREGQKHASRRCDLAYAAGAGEGEEADRPASLSDCSIVAVHNAVRIGPGSSALIASKTIARRLA